MAKRSDFDADVIILGAGVAGLSAARQLTGDHSVIVVEARDRVGGRLHTRRHGDHPLPVELGPEFVHGHMPDTFDLLAEAGLIAYDLADKHDTARGGTLVSQAKAWERASAIVERVGSVGKDDLSFDDFLREHARGASPVARRMARMFVEGFNAADARDISCRSLAKAAAEEARQEDGEKQYKLVGGYDQLAAALARSVRPRSRIELSTVVRAVRWRRGAIEVSCRGPAGERTLRAPKAIVALPLGVLQQPADAPGGVRFEPELPTRTLIADGLAMGRVVKLTIRFRSAFWESLGHKELGFIHRSDVAFPTWWSTLPLRSNLLTAWAGGPAADAITAGGGDPSTAAIDSLAAIFALPRRRVADQVERVDHHDWLADPFSRGAYSYARVGGADAPEAIARPIAGTLYFAGEHTHGGLLGTVAGAIHSGKRAAAQASRRPRLTPRSSG